MAKKRLRQCKAKDCEEMFEPRNLQHQCHHWTCAMAYAKELKEKRAAKDKRKAVKEFKANDKSHLMKDCQKIANKIGKTSAYLRGFTYCATCPIELSTQIQVDGGHGFPTSTYSGIRFYTLQILPQCVKCNRYNSGMRVEFENKLIELYGGEKVEWFRSFKGKTHKFTVEYLKKYKRVMSKRLKVLEDRLKGKL